MHSKREAQRRVDRIRAFREELAALRSEGAVVLEPQQEARLDEHLKRTLAELAAHFDVDTTESEKQVSWGMRIASTIAGMALCTAVVLFFYRIWGALSIPLQVAVLVVTPLAAIAAMEFASRRERTPYYTTLLGAIAFAAAVLNLSALAGIFNVTDSPNGFLVWAVFGLGLAYAYRLRLLLAAGLVCAITFVAMMLAAWSGLFWTDFPARVETAIFPSAIVAAVPFVLKHRKIEDFPWVYRMIGLTVVFCAIVMASLWGGLSYLPFERRTVEITYQFAGMAVAAVVTWRGVLHSMRSIVYLGAFSFAVFLYLRLFRWWWDWMPKYLFFLLIGLILLGLLYFFQRLRRRMMKERAS